MEQTCLFRGATPRPRRQNTVYKDTPVKRDGEHVAHLDLVGGLLDLVAIDPNSSRLCELGSE